MAAMAALVRSNAQALKTARELGLPCQIAGAILRYVTVGAPQHLLRARMWSPEALATYDAAVKEAWEDVIQTKLNDDQLMLGDLPLREGGASFGLAAPRAAAAFLTGWRRELWASSGGSPIHTDGGLRRLLPRLAEDVEAAVTDIHIRAPNLNCDRRLDFTKQPAKRLQQELEGNYGRHKGQLASQDVSHTAGSGAAQWGPRLWRFPARAVEGCYSHCKWPMANGLAPPPAMQSSSDRCSSSCGDALFALWSSGCLRGAARGGHRACACHWVQNRRWCCRRT